MIGLTSEITDEDRCGQWDHHLHKNDDTIYNKYAKVCHGNKMENHPYLENSKEIAENVNYLLTHEIYKEGSSWK